MDYIYRVEIVSGVRTGKPVIKGTRMTPKDVLEYLTAGMSYEEVLADFPYITKEDILACIAFASDE